MPFEARAVKSFIAKAREQNLYTALFAQITADALLNLPHVRRKGGLTLLVEELDPVNILLPLELATKAKPKHTWTLTTSLKQIRLGGLQLRAPSYDATIDTNFPPQTGEMRSLAPAVFALSVDLGRNIPERHFFVLPSKATLQNTHQPTAARR